MQGSADHWARLSDMVSETMGLHFPEARREDLQRGVLAAGRELGFEDADACAQWLASGPLTPAQVSLLSAHLTIGETYFFREHQAYDALVELMLPELQRMRRAGDRRLRLWSAACCTGEEPYSLAIALHRALPDLADWNLTLLATDINARFLEKAAAGIYGKWSFRDDAYGIRPRYFRRTADGRYAVVPEIRNLVTFAQLNLAEHVYPAHTTAMDVIFCRNVLMYFAPGPMRDVIARLHAALAPGGWLVVSPSEASHTLFPQFVAVNRPGLILYRKPDPARGISLPARADVPQNPPADRAMPSDPADPPRRSRTRHSTEAAAEPHGHARPAGRDPGKARKQPDTPSACADKARWHANRGELDQALAWCERWTAADKLDPASHYLRAVVLLAAGRDDDAKAALGRSLFVRPDYVLAHYALGSLALRAGAGDEARRHLGNALQLLEGVDADEPVPESDGLTAGRLMEMIVSTMERPSAR